MLVTDLSKISFLEILELVTGPIEVVRCLSGEEECGMAANCNVASPLKSFNEKLVSFYRGMPVADLLQNRESGRIDFKREAL